MATAFICVHLKSIRHIENDFQEILHEEEPEAWIIIVALRRIAVNLAWTEITGNQSETQYESSDQSDARS